MGLKLNEKGTSCFTLDLLSLNWCSSVSEIIFSPLTLGKNRRGKRKILEIEDKLLKFSSTSYLSITLCKLLQFFVPQFPHWSSGILTLNLKGSICLDSIKYIKYIVKCLEFITERKNDNTRENCLVRVQINKLKGKLFVCLAIQFAGTEMFYNFHSRRCSSCQHTTEWFWRTPGLYNTGWQPGLLDLLLLLLFILISFFNHINLENLFFPPSLVLFLFLLLL